MVRSAPSSPSASSTSLVAKLTKLRPGIDLMTYLATASLFAALFIGLTMRISGFAAYDPIAYPQRVKYGLYLSEFDSYWHLRSAKYIEENGLRAFYDWTDKMSWYPFGRAAGPSTPPGLPLLTAVLHQFITALGFPVDIADLAIFFPPISSVVAMLSVFLLGSELAGPPAGLLSALFLALNGSHIERTNLGFFKHETIGVPAIVLSTFFFLKALKSKDYRYSAVYALASGVTMGYLMLSWTGYVFQIGLTALITLVCLLLKKVPIDTLLVDYVATQGVALLIATQSPRSAAEITSLYIYAVIFTVALLLAVKMSSTIRAGKFKAPIYIGMMAGVAVVSLFLFQLGYLGSLYGKLLAVVWPSIRIDQAIIESVAEHKITNWYSLFTDHGFLLLFFGVAVFSSLRKLDLGNIFLLSGGLSSLYFANMMARLSLIFSPFLVVVASVGITQSLGIQGLQSAYSAVQRVAGRRRKTAETASRAYENMLPVGILMIVFVLLAWNLVLDPQYSMVQTRMGSPVTIATASTPYPVYFPDWLQAVSWIRENTPPGSVIMSWWDYGYWITTLGERPTLVDNATINSTQVALVGKALISNDTIALPIMKRLNVSYVAVFSTLSLSQSIGFWGDEVKWIWMAEIGYNMKSEPLTHATARSRFGDAEVGTKLTKLGLLKASSDGSSPIELPKKDYVLTKLMVFGAFLDQQNVVDVGPHFELVFRSTTIPGGAYSLVSIYKVKYDYTVQLQGTLEAKPDKLNDSYTLSYPISQGRSAELTINSSEISNGSYELGGSVSNLDAKALFVLKRQSGEIVRSWVARKGKHTLNFFSDRIEYYLDGTLIEKLAYNHTGPLNIGVFCEVSKAPANATLTVSPKARVTLLSAKVALLP